MKDKLLAELKSVLLTSLFFFSWFGVFMIIKVLLLREYEIEFVGLSKVLIGSLIAAKVVLILEYVHFSFTKKLPAIVDIMIRTILYSVGVLVVLVLERSFESRHEYGSFGNAISNVFDNINMYHIWANTVCVFGSLLFFNFWSVVKPYLGAGGLRAILFSRDSSEAVVQTKK
jgi:hypothetical protein